MMRRSTSLIILTMCLCAIACLATGISPAAAGDSDRSERWEFYIPVNSISSEDFDGKGGTSVDLAGDVGFGFAFGYNFNERWILGFEFTFMDMNFDASVARDTDQDGDPDDFLLVSGELDSNSLQITGQYNFLEKTITPFIRASLGSTYVDSNIPSGQPTGVCWWHPWWGYICDIWQPTYDDSSFSYGAGVGVRADVGERFYLEGSANQLRIDFENADEPEFTFYRLNMGWLF
jgi:opacity protein-like surface antigen